MLFCEKKSVLCFVFCVLRFAFCVLRLVRMEDVELGPASDEQKLSDHHDRTETEGFSRYFYAFCSGICYGFGGALFGAIFANWPMMMWIFLMGPDPDYFVYIVVVGSCSGAMGLLGFMIGFASSLGYLPDD